MPPYNNDTGLSFPFWKNPIEICCIRNNNVPSGVVPTTMKATKRRRSVRFDPQVLVYNILPRSEFTPQERRAAYCSKSDFKAFRRDASANAKILATDDLQFLLDDVQFTARGSHCRLEHVAKRRYEWKSHSKIAVLGLQNTQRIPGSLLDADDIAIAYAAVSRAAGVEARAMAAPDEEDAKKYQEETPRLANTRKEDFNDDWITSVSSSESSDDDSSDSGDYAFFDDSGFDDSWIRDVSSSSQPLLIAL